MKGVAETIEKLGTTNIALAMGLPISTIHTWKDADAIPGKGMLHDLKVEAFKRAAKKVERKKKREETKRKAA